MDHRKAQAMRLRIRLLGPPTFEYGRRPIILRRRQVRALLCYLASVSEPIPRERLCSLFWPDCPEIQARRKLSHLATHLQRAMPPGRWLNIQGDQIGLSFPKVWVDLHVFAEALPASGAGRSPLESRPLDRQTLDRLQDAIKLYRGDLMCDVELAESSEFELWACTEREHWRREYLRALALLVNGYAALGDLHSAIKFATGYLETDELSEEMHRQLIELYAASGQRACALRQYELCVATLERELGVDPLPETRAVYQAALRGAAPIPALSTEPLPPPLLDAPLVGHVGDADLAEVGQARLRAD